MTNTFICTICWQIDFLQFVFFQTFSDLCPNLFDGRNSFLVSVCKITTSHVNSQIGSTCGRALFGDLLTPVFSVYCFVLYVVWVEFLLAEFVGSVAKVFGKDKTSSSLEKQNTCLNALLDRFRLSKLTGLESEGLSY